jgi:hypothetical protein
MLVSSPVAAFIDDRLVETDVEVEWVDVVTCWSIYTTWAALGGERPLKRRDFEDALDDVGYEKRRIRRGSTRAVVWVGLKQRGPEVA